MNVHLSFAILVRNLLIYPYLKKIYCKPKGQHTIVHYSYKVIRDVVITNVISFSRHELSSVKVILEDNIIETFSFSCNN